MRISNIIFCEIRNRVGGREDCMFISYIINQADCYLSALDQELLLSC